MESDGNTASFFFLSPLSYFIASVLCSFSLATRGEGKVFVRRIIEHWGEIGRRVFFFFLLFGGIFSMEKFHEGEKERDNRDRSPTSVINSKEWCTIVARLSRWILSRERCRRRRRNEQSRDKVNENRMERFLIQSVICEHETPPTESEGNIRSQFWMFSFGEGGVIKLATPVLSPLSASILIRCLNSVSYWQSCSFVFLKMQMWYDRAFVRSIGPDR